MRRRKHAVRSRTIAIPQRNVGVLFQKKTDMFGGKLLAANEDLPQAAEAVRTFVHKEVEERGGEPEGIYPPDLDKISQSGRQQMGFPSYDRTCRRPLKQSGHSSIKRLKSEVVSQRESTPLTWIRSRRASGSRWASSTSAEVPPLVSWPHSSNAYISQGSGAACGIT